MQMIKVNSSAMDAIGYDPSARRMTIRFNQGSSYDFCNVPQSVFDGLLNAYSKGSFYNDNIKDRYQC